MDPKDAQALQNQDALPETDSAGNPITRASNVQTVNAMFPNLPEGARVVAGPIPGPLGAVTDLVGGLANTATQGALNNTAVNNVNTSVKSNPNETKQDALDTRLGLTSTGKTAQEATKQIGQIEGPQATDAGQKLQNEGNNLITQGQVNGLNAQRDRELAIDQSNKALLNAETDLKTAASKAQIDPQNYIKNMGTSQKVFTSIGLALSGIGSGLSGQSNMANDMLQKNIDRDISAQKQNYVNAYNQYLGHKAQSQTALERANIANAAQNLAALTVNTGASLYTAGLQTKLAGMTAKQRADILNNQIQQKMAEAKQNIDTQYITATQSGDVTTSNMLAGLANIVATYANKGGVNRFSLNPAKTNPSSIMNTSQLPQSEGPSTYQSEQPMEQKDPETQTFLDKIANSGEIGAFGEKNTKGKK